LAGAIVELAHKALACDFRRIDPAAAKVLLIEAGERILPSFPPALSAAAQRQLEALGVEVVTGGAVTACDMAGIGVSGRGRIGAATVLWAAGVMASPAGRWLGAEVDRAGRVKVTAGLTLPDDDRIFVLGDTATVAGSDGRPVPGVAPAAKQMGRHAARAILAHLAGGPAPSPFRYRDWGNLATIGRKAAVADFGRLRLSGLPAWLVWSLAHVFFLIGFRNRLAVLLDWTISYFTFGRGARLISD
jgi:NADH dehydrogenase